jgi:uncharacterized protein (TIGR02246 family)
MNDFAAAEAEIRQLYARYADAVWRKDFDAVAHCYTEDAEWRIGGAVVSGRAGIVGHLKMVLAKFERVLVTLRTPVVAVAVAVAGATATSRAYLTEQGAFTDGHAITPVGTYFDRMVRQADRWRFTWRLFQTCYVGPPDLSGAFYENPDFGPPPAMPKLDAMTFNRTGMHVQKDG